MILSEADDNTSVYELIYTTYKNFLKLLTRKLNFKINRINYRVFKNMSKRIFLDLATDFPNLTFVHVPEDDRLNTRNVVNISYMFATQYAFQTTIYPYTFPERLAAPPDSCARILDPSTDPLLKSLLLHEQEEWLYKNIDPVFAYPTLVRSTYRKARQAIVEQCLYIHWFDSVDPC
jgi:hypothetical protein